MKVFLFFTLNQLSITSKLEFDAPFSKDTPLVISYISVALNDPLPTISHAPFCNWNSPKAFTCPPSPDKSKTGSVTTWSNVSATVPDSA